MPKNTTTAVARTLIGYWHDTEDPPYSHPQPLVDHAWEPARRQRIIDYLESGRAYAYFCGHSYCRFGCTEPYWSKTDDPSKGEYREEKAIVIRDGREETVLSVASGYYVQTVGRMHIGSRGFCDDVWCWPQGLAHYVETHGIRLPDEFVAHAAARGFRAAGAVPVPIREDARLWRDWCSTNAPFEYETHCIACNPGRF
jgi:hypothetical protein